MKIKERRCLNLVLHNARHVRPEKSVAHVLCYVQTKTSVMAPIILPYSKKNDHFNSLDSLDAKTSAEHCVSVLFWAELPEVENANR